MQRLLLAKRFGCLYIYSSLNYFSKSPLIKRLDIYFLTYYCNGTNIYYIYKYFLSYKSWRNFKVIDNIKHYLTFLCNINNNDNDNNKMILSLLIEFMMIINASIDTVHIHISTISYISIKSFLLRLQFKSSKIMNWIWNILEFFFVTKKAIIC